MTSKRKNSITLNIGGAERTLKFSMSTQELYVDTLAKITKENPEVNVANSFWQMKLLFYCALVIGDNEQGGLPEGFDVKATGKWIDDCEDERFGEANDFAIECMGFISSAESKTLGRLVDQSKAMGMKVEDLLKLSDLKKS